MKICKDCQKPSIYHIRTWLETLVSHLLPTCFLIEEYSGALIEKLLLFFHLASFRDDFTDSNIQLRTTCFIAEAKKYGVKFKVLCGPFGHTNHFQMEVGKKVFRFEGLPRAEFLSKARTQIIDDKELVKKHLKKGNFPIAEGKSFWFFQKKKALQWAQVQLGFPLVVKPREGSLSQHVTTNIQNPEKLKHAIDKAIVYSPAFIIEKFIPKTFVYRATVIDFDFVAVVQQIPANVIGDGAHTIQELIERKNKDAKRGQPKQKEFILSKLVVNETTKKLLKDKGYNFSTVPKKGGMVLLQKDSFLKLGGDLREITSEVHPDNFHLFRQVAKFFETRLVGIDFLAQDISLSWKNQTSAILELNSIPCIEMHHFPSSGKPQNVAKALVKMVLKYYL